MTLSDTHMRPKAVAIMLGVAESTLTGWRTRYKHLGPPWVKIGGRIWYNREAVEDFINGTNKKERTLPND